MPLSLRITSYQRLTPGQEDTFRMAQDSLTIGRSNDNDWVIPDPQRFLSGTHCSIEARGDGYFLTDLSTNGVFVNGSETRLDRNSSVALSDGDRFRIGDYEFVVDIEAGDRLEQSETPTAAFAAFDDSAEADPFADLSGPQEVDDDDDFMAEGAPDSPLDPAGDNDLGQGMDLDHLLDLDDEDEDAEVQQDRPAYSPIEEPMARPDPAPSPVAEIPDNWDEATGMFVAPEAGGDGNDLAIPDDWDENTGTFGGEPPTAPKPAPPPPAPEPAPQPEPKPAPAPAPRPAASAVSSGQAVAAFARGAGLDPSVLAIDDETQFFEELGKMAMGFTEGIMRTLSGRASVKNEFRLDQTMIRPMENNPLKFSPLARDALVRLLKHTDKAYLQGEAAVREGFEDINAHQIAVMAGMEAALQGLLEKFEPSALERRLVSHSVLDNILPGAKKAKYWDIFTLMYQEIASDAEDDFQQVFGNEFSRAYEKQLDRLKNNRRE